MPGGGVIHQADELLPSGRHSNRGFTDLDQHPQSNVGKPGNDERLSCIAERDQPRATDESGTTENPRVGKEDDEVLSWLRTMSNDRFRRLPVVDNQGRIKAIFTQGDFVSYTWPDLLYQATQMTKASLTKHFNATSIIVMIMLYSVAMIMAIRFI